VIRKISQIYILLPVSQYVGFEVFMVVEIKVEHPAAPILTLKMVRHKGPPKLWYPIAMLHGVTIRKTRF